MMRTHRQPQAIPVRLYQTDEHLMIAAPMPGLEPEDIAVSIQDGQVTIRGVERGPGQHTRDVLLDEWTTGPYYREVALPEPVDGSLTNATYGNGVLVLAMPKAKRRKQTVPAELKLDTINSSPRGERIGHSGSAIRPTTTAEYRRKHPAKRQHNKG